MTDVEARALGELLQAIETRVNRLQEALECRIELSPVQLPMDEGWLSVSERLAELEDSAHHRDTESKESTEQTSPRGVSPEL